MKYSGMIVLVYCCSIAGVFIPRACAEDIEARAYAVGGRYLTNSLGMIFAPLLGTNMFVSVWITRVQDYQAYTTSRVKDWRRPDFTQDQTHPAVNVSWYDAKDFCAWLTEKDRRESRISAEQNYRLPTSSEWTLAAGFMTNHFTNVIKSEKDYPWGCQWPPPYGVGNYHPRLGIDNFQYTSPVGSFPANILGLYDMGGNVWQWCEDQPDQSRVDRPQRGGAWADYTPNILLLFACPRNSPLTRNEVVGFRVVLANKEQTD